MNGIIIGGGIAGLTTAHALNQINIKTQVYESAPTIKAVGAGLVLGTNAMQILDRLDLAEKVIEVGNSLKTFEITDHKLNRLQVVFQEKAKTRFGFYGTAIHRADLHRILLNELQEEQVILGHKLSSIEESSKKRIAHFENGASKEADFLIGADGIHSNVRKSIMPPVKMRNTNQYCWRGITAMPSKFPNPNSAIESWGDQKRFGLVPTGKGKLYWFAVVSERKWKEKKGQNDKSALLEAFSSFDPLIQDTIEGTASDAILRNDIYDFAPISTWYKGNVCLLGDAAHAMTPNMGQGACQAIEDAYHLAKAMKEHPQIAQTFLKFQKNRKPRVDRIVKQSMQIGKMAHIPMGQIIRNVLMRWTPQSVAEKQLNFLYTVN